MFAFMNLGIQELSAAECDAFAGTSGYSWNVYGSST